MLTSAEIVTAGNAVHPGVAVKVLVKLSPGDKVEIDGQVIVPPAKLPPSDAVLNKRLFGIVLDIITLEA